MDNRRNKRKDPPKRKTQYEKERTREEVEQIKKNLIKENFDEYFNFEELDEKDNNEKQLYLDHFLNR